jgi:enoyl reductase-like protein
MSRRLLRVARLHVACRGVYRQDMARRLNVTLDDERAAKLARMAERMHVQEGTLARSLLATALDEADPDPRSIAALLDAIPGAYDRARLGAEQARRGETIALDEL